MGNILGDIVDAWKTAKRYRLKKKFRIPLLVLFLAVLLSVGGSVVFSVVADYHHHLKNPKVYGKVKVDWYKDLNPIHLKYAKQNGIKPFKKNKDFHSELEQLLKNGQLVHVRDKKNYHVDHLTHSHPYLTPAGRDFLDELGKRFQKKLNENKMGKYAFQVSSLLRTEESQRKLSKSNVNATSHSSHLYGTTFDIAYGTVIKKPLPWIKVQIADPKAIKLLSEAIGELRAEGKCVVVTERIERCFHITVTR